jgi:8-oxo-dGTP pyrophosphatase MutT (NUDIX family)
MIVGAGILFRCKDGSVLFLKRGAGGDCAGCWAFPGGKAESFEHGVVERTAIRETREETGFDASRLNLKDHTRTISINEAGKEVDFTTFLVNIAEPFMPELSDEHTAYAWAPADDPPQPLHPGAGIALARITMDELGVARAMAAGQLTSPQHYENVWLFAIRITGTGRAYRVNLEEFVWRDPNIYLTDEFLARCNGLPVIMEHPEKSTLDSKEFNDRIVGTVFLPYLQGNEVWGIAKVYDDATAQMMRKFDLSTSPAVVFRKGDGTKLQLEDGRALFIEGKPSLLDHIAICEQGVWDKGGEPQGISINDSNGVTKVAEETKAEREEREDKARRDAEEKERADKARKDAEEAAKEREERMDAIADRILTGIDSLEKRMDAIEKRRKDEEQPEGESRETAADKARKDAEEKERADAEEEAAREKAAADAKRKDEEEAKEKEEREDAQRRADAVAQRLSDLERSMPRAMTDSDYQEIRSAQAMAEPAYAAFGDSAPAPLTGETLQQYRRRLADGRKVHSAAWKDTNLYAISDDNAFGNIERMIYADAVAKAKSVDDVPEGDLRQMVRADSTGRQITEFYGHPKAWMSAFAGRRRRVGGFRQEARH